MEIVAFDVETKAFEADATAAEAGLVAFVELAAANDDSAAFEFEVEATCAELAAALDELIATT